jgi:Zn-dependent metalloprotease
MWYGQTIHKGQRRSLARHLDIVAHELTHGVIEATCNLVYREESGALNESFSDIFGVIVKNAVKRPDADPRDWEWEIGPGLGETTKKPLRDLSNPKRTGDPGHIKDMWTLNPGEQPNEHNDDGYVHSNSNIHNKAAYNLLVATAPGKKGKKRPPLVFDPDDVARLYYYTLQRIDRTADFEDVYFMLLDVARTLFPDQAEQAAKLAAITRAYGAVGIPRS